MYKCIQPAMPEIVPLLIAVELENISHIIAGAFTGILICTILLLGDVYLLNGQSNMELQVGRILDHIGHEPEMIDRPQIREFRAPIRLGKERLQVRVEAGIVVMGVGIEEHGGGSSTLNI